MIVKTLIVAASVWLVLVVLAWLFQRKLIYQPGFGSAPRAAQVLSGARDVTYRTEDGLDLGAWFVRGRGKESGATVVVFNGNAGSRLLRSPLGDAVAEAGHAVLLTDYRGYGGNPGSPSEQGLLLDARAAVGWLRDRDDVDPDRIVYFGESLGAAVAIGLAVEIPPAGLILRSPFTSLVDAANSALPILPAGLLLKDRFPNADRIPGITSPLLVVAGGRDSIIPLGQSRAVFDAAPEPKSWYLIPGADHNDYDLLAGDEFVAEIVRFLDAIAVPPPEP